MTEDYPYREIIEMCSTGMTQSKVAFLCGCGAQKVASVTQRAHQLGIGWPVPPELTEAELAHLVDPHENARRYQPDFPRIIADAGCRADMAHVDKLYGAYLVHAEEDGGEPYARVTFERKVRAWASDAHPKLSMRVNWHRAECCQLDWAARSIPVHGSDGSSTPAFLFLATLPYSDYTFVRASLDMGMQSWLEHNVAAFEFFGGVPLFDIIDNLRVGVTFCRQGKKVNERYRDLADHYGTIVLPAKSYSPTWKGAVECHVKIMGNGIVSTLEKMEFSSIAQLNNAIGELVELYNDRPMRSAGGRSRRQIFLAEEKAELQPLPKEPFEPVTWKKVCAMGDAVVQVRGNYYGVPENFASCKLIARIGTNDIDVYTRDKRQCVAHHRRRTDGLETFEGLAGGCPDRFLPLDEWAQAHGRTKVIEQWDVARNGSLKPHDVVCRSQKRVWWLCPDCGFSWCEAPARRTGRSFDDCLACADVELVSGKNDLATTHPELAAEWSKRNPLPASHVFADFHQMFWWEGQCGHVWRAPVSKRAESAYGRLCPYCSGQKGLAGFNDVATLAPELARLWHPSKNRGMPPESTAVNSHREVYLWNGVLSRIWRQSPYQWMRENGFAEVMEPFESLVRDARERDREPNSGGSSSFSGGKTVVKWTRFLQSSNLLVSFEEYCKSFGHEDLLAEWDFRRNSDLGPGDVTRATTERVWWKGSECGHSWKESVRSRVFRGAGCVYCNRTRVLPGYNSVECLDAALPAKWHPTKNGDLTPESVSDRTAKRLWWLCPRCGYEWQESLRLTSSNSRKCPNCSHEKRYGFKVAKHNVLAAKRPDIASQWHAYLNAPMTLEEALTGSSKPVWWRGKCGHVWRESISQRTARIDASCPYCANRKLLSGLNDLGTLRPDLASELHPMLNEGLDPGCVRVNSTALVWWLGKCGHEWQARPAERTAGAGCPYCSNHRVLTGFNDLVHTHPELSAQWDTDLNGDFGPGDVTAGSAHRVWWRCELGHTWQIGVVNRTQSDAGCPVCGMRQVLKGFNDLKTTHSKIARQLHPTKNNGLKATEIMANSCKAVWWRCELGHEWKIPVVNRTKISGHDPGCPYCHNRKVWSGFNDLATLEPLIAQLWHPHLNKGVTPRDVVAGAKREVWWKGLNCGHTYKMPVYQRVAASRSYCPYCSGRKKPEREIKGI